MLLSDLLLSVPVQTLPDKDYEICDIVYDSRKAYEGVVFVCLAGTQSDGHDYAKSAYQNGCRVFLAQKPLDLPDDACVVITDNTRSALASISAEFFSHPERRLKLIGITGTKGKTTVTKLTRDILTAGGINTATIGTNGIFINGEHTPTVNTTPESYELYKAFDKMVNSGVEVCVTEVSSQAYLTHRVDGITFDIGVFTNLAYDHIGNGEHPDFENYMECKAHLFENSRFAIYNADDEHYTDIRKGAKCPSQTYSANGHADYFATLINEYKTDTSLGVSFECHALTGMIPIKLKMPGKFNVYNALAAIAAAKRLGVRDEVIAEALKTSTVDGRFEIVDALDYATVIIDYAHNGFSMQNLLDTVRRYSPRRLVVLFGSVGSRTEIRRKELGDVCAKCADFSIITSDNPDFEDPDAIIADIEQSFIGKATPYVKIADRAEAIRYALKNACVGDVILLAGKGHERYQLIEGKHVHFDEREVIADYMRELTAQNIS
ncbi:MAG: UDP-N-acetylmuramoyl-L-alanyl-D-glutamate--2,6-diaminopimelate ligase [Clostridia bacterium]|nr:UDP-N-acetylmuramoyl-L-alanyl-D-glutamate--2,6-diaminopimelate ligase [Clostridia bacterium]